MKVEVEIEDGVVPEGQEIVRIGCPEKGERHVMSKGQCIIAGFDTTVPFIIVRDKWTPGSVSLKLGWVAMDSGESWWWHREKPELECGEWFSDEFIPLKNINWTPPPCTGPEDSLREIK